MTGFTKQTSILKKRDVLAVRFNLCLSTLLLNAIYKTTPFIRSDAKEVSQNTSEKKVLPFF